MCVCVYSRIRVLLPAERKGKEVRSAVGKRRSERHEERSRVRCSSRARFWNRALSNRLVRGRWKMDGVKITSLTDGMLPGATFLRIKPNCDELPSILFHFDNHIPLSSGVAKRNPADDQRVVPTLLHGTRRCKRCGRRSVCVCAARMWMRMHVWCGCNFLGEDSLIFCAINLASASRARHWHLLPVSLQWHKTRYLFFVATSPRKHKGKRGWGMSWLEVDILYDDVGGLYPTYDYFLSVLRWFSIYGGDDMSSSTATCPWDRFLWSFCTSLRGRT